MREVTLISVSIFESHKMFASTEKLKTFHSVSLADLNLWVVTFGKHIFLIVLENPNHKSIFIEIS